jgi:phosphate-selective porin OprO/OprP
MIARQRFALYVSLVLFATTVFQSSAAAQAQKETTKPEQTAAKVQGGFVGARTGARPGDPKAETEPADNAGRKAGSSAELDMLRVQVDRLKSLVEQQQRSLADMKKQLDELSSRSRGFTADFTSGPCDSIRAATVATPPSAEPTISGTSGPASTSRPTTQKEAPVAAGWDGNHAFLRSADGGFETYLTGYAQLDFRGYAAGVHPPDTFLVRRARLALEGKLFRYFEYKVEGDLADGTGTLLRDGWVRIHRIDEFQVTAGQFRVPFSQEEIRPDNVQDFVERSIVNSLAPSRSPGIMVSGAVAAGAFEYQLGAFNGKGLLANNNNGTPENALRLRVSPWKATDIFMLKGLAFGGAFTVGRNVNAQSLRGLTESRSFIYFAAEPVNGKLTRTNGELTWLLGPAAIRAEYDQVNQARDNLGAKGTNLPGVVAKGYTAQFTYLLTGENKLEAGSVEPRHNLFSNEGGKTGLGAWELKARYASLQFSDASAKSNRAQTIFFGANWYLNKFVRYVFDAGLERYTDPKRSPNPGDTNYFVVLSRIQVAF